MNTVKQEAFRLRAAGLNLLPIKTDGSKTPALATWSAYTSMKAGAEEMDAWFGPKAPLRGLSVVCGDTSGNHIVVDGDVATGDYLIPLLVVGIRLGLTASTELLAKWESAPVTRTPSGGWQKHLRCTEPIGKGEKLARRPYEVPEGTDGARLIEGKWIRPETLIETRGQGHIAILPPSPAACHPDRKPYVLESGDLADVPTVTPGDLGEILNCCRSFNEFTPPEKVATDQPRTKADAQTGERPGDAYNRQADIQALAEKHGWHLAGKHIETELWARPGKTRGISATFNHAGSNKFYVFSTNAYPLEAEKAYSPFALFTFLEHGGVFSAAASELYAQGFGDRTRGYQDAEGDTDDESECPQDAQGDSETGASSKKSLPHVLPSVARVLRGLPVTVDASGLHVSADATGTERKQIFRGLMRLGSETQLWLRFAIGDAYNALPGARGERIRWVSEQYGAGMLQTVKNYAWVSGRWDHARRNTDLPWTFYTETSDHCFGLVDQDELLAKWFAGGLTVDAIRQMKRERKATADGSRGAGAEEATSDQTRLHQGRAVMSGAEDILGLLPDDCRADLRFLLDNGGLDYLRALLRQGRADLAPETSPGTGNKAPSEDQENTLFEAFSEGETSKGLTFLPDDPPPTEAADSHGEESFEIRGETAEKVGASGTVTLTKIVNYYRDETGEADAPPTAPIPNVFPDMSPVAECLRDPTWPRAWERWMRFSGLENGQAMPDAVTDQIVALRPLWEAKHAPRQHAPRQHASSGDRPCRSA